MLLSSISGKYTDYDLQKFTRKTFLFIHIVILYMNSTGNLFTLPRAAGTMVIFIILFGAIMPNILNPSIAWIKGLVITLVVVMLVISGVAWAWSWIE